MIWLQLIVQKLIQPFFHHLPGRILSWASSLSLDSNLKTMNDVEKELLRWGWVIENKTFTPIMIDNEAGPPDPLKVVCCSCKGPCGNSCSCRNAGLNCASICKGCHCTNAPVNEPEVEEDKHGRNFWTYLISLM